MNVKILMFFTIVFTIILSYSHIVLADDYIERNDKELDNLQSLSMESNRYNNVFIVAGGDVKNLSTTNDDVIEQDRKIEQDDIAEQDRNRKYDSQLKQKDITEQDRNRKYGSQLKQDDITEQDRNRKLSNDINNGGEKQVINSPLRSTTTELSSYPSWVQNPNVNGYFATAVGSSKHNHEKGLSYQKRMARIQANAELSKIISVQIDNELERTSVHSDGTQIKYDINQKSRHRSSSKLENVEQLDDWLDPVTNDYYILLGIKVKPVLD